MKKIIVHNDLDGVASAALLIRATNIKKVIFSSNIRKDTSIKINKDTIIADLMFDPRCGLWFDHHISHKINKNFKGKFALKKSCAGVIFNYFNERFTSYYQKLVKQLDKADSGNFSLKDVKKETPLFQLNSLLFLYPFKNKEQETLILNMVLNSFLLEIPIKKIIEDKKISNLLKDFKKLNKKSISFIKKKAIIKNRILIIDSSDKVRTFHPFLIFIKYHRIKYLLIVKPRDKNDLSVLIVKNRFNNFIQKSNIGFLCKNYGGGGHKEVGGFLLSKKSKNKIIKQIIQKLK